MKQETPNPEFVIWGISPKHGEDEAPLVTGLGSRDRAEYLLKTLKSEHGCYNLRIQKIDLTQPLEWDARRMVK